MATQGSTDERLAQVARDGHSLCWHCQAERGHEPLCPHCVKIQPLGAGSDYFSVMGLPRKLNLDPRVLEPVFHALSRRFHPDVYRMASPRERIIALENSALLNQAYRTLRDPFERAAYLLGLEQGGQWENRAAPPEDLFEEILDVQEVLAAFKFAEGEEQAALRSRLEAKRDELQAEQDQRAEELTGNLFARWDALQERSASGAEKTPLLARMGRLLGERAYLRRVLNSLNEALIREAHGENSAAPGRGPSS
jgi:molecular chaperone HscB